MSKCRFSIACLFSALVIKILLTDRYFTPPPCQILKTVLYFLQMETLVLNYRIIIEPEIEEKTGRKIYTAFCPRLGVADWGKTLEEAINHIKEGIECYLQSLIKHKKPIPSQDSTEFMVTTAEVFLPKNLKFTYP